MHRFFRHNLTRVLATALGTLLVLAALVAVNRRGPASARAATLCTTLPVMDATGMATLLAQRYRVTPQHASARIIAVNSTDVAAADTFLVSNYQFNADHNPGTQVDYVHINQGQSVMFKWVNGIHTTTSGNPGDPDEGSLWDYGIGVNQQITVVQFLDPGTFPFHCYFHGATNNMVGGVVVNPVVTPTRSVTWGGLKTHYR